MWEIASVVITSLNMGFTDLPSTASSYDGVERDVSKFYQQHIPDIEVGGYHILDKNDRIKAKVSTGTYTEKLDIYPTINFEWEHITELNDEWSILTSLGGKLSLGNHNRPCTDSFDRKYYCGNLTAWSDFKGNKHETFEPKIGITLTRHW